MKSNEILTEWSVIDPAIKKEMVKKGYKFLGSGADQMAFLEPGTGHVLKIFGTQDHLEGQKTEFSDDHKMFLTWAKFCMQNSNNKFLPKFFGYDSFVYRNYNYLQIRQERLTSSGVLGKYLAEIAEWLESGTEKSIMNPKMNSKFPSLQRVVTLATPLIGGEEELRAFLTTAKSLRKISDRKEWQWDLHHQNIMKRGSTPVIMDPWVVADSDEGGAWGW